MKFTSEAKMEVLRVGRFEAGELAGQQCITINLTSHLIVTWPATISIRFALKQKTVIVVRRSR